jgi:hypothetical protein
MLPKGIDFLDFPYDLFVLLCQYLSAFEHGEKNLVNYNESTKSKQEIQYVQGKRYDKSTTPERCSVPRWPSEYD